MKRKSLEELLFDQKVRESHVKALRRLKMLPDNVQNKFSKLELYHMVRLHHSWFSTAKRKQYDTQTEECANCLG